MGEPLLTACSVERAEPIMDIVEVLSRFSGANLTQTLARIEGEIRGLDLRGCMAFLDGSCATREVLSAAAAMKRLAGQIDVTMHAIGILRCLPHILEEGERVDYVSLGAGNTGRDFDLETDRRVAEFKFIQWRGGPESIRQNGVFKDFFELAESDTPKRKHLYLLGTHHALKFFKGGRRLTSVLSKNETVRTRFRERFGDRYARVRDYFEAHSDRVLIEDVSPWLAELAGGIIGADLEQEH